MKFLYQARTKEGELKSGTIIASSKEVALFMLQKMNLYVTFLEEEKPLVFAREITIFKKISFKDIFSFSRQLSMMLSSRVPIIESLSTLSAQTKNLQLKEIIYDLAKEVEVGSPLSKALSKYKQIFSPFFIGIVKAGEKAGKLPECLNYLADYLEREYNFRSKVRGAMIYPAVVFVLFLFISVLMIFSILPSFEKILLETQAELQVELPFFTKIVLSFSHGIRNYGLFLFFLFFLFILSIFYFLKTEKGKNFFDKVLISLPFLGQISKNSTISRFSGNLATLLTAGIMVTDALEITEEIVGQKIYQKAISDIKEGVKKGNPISSISNLYPNLFPPLFNQMVLVGEKTGTLPQVLETIANFYQSEVERSIENLLRALEPLLIILMGGLVGGLMATVLIPLYKMIGAF